MSVVPLRRRPGPPVRIALALALAISGAACGGQSGVLLEVHKDERFASEVYALKVFVGVGHHDELFDPAWRVAAKLDPSVAEVTLDGELGAATYRILLEPGEGLAAGQDLIVAVAGYKAGQRKPVGFGHTAGTVQFADGQVRVIDLPLTTFRDARHGVTASGCAWWNDRDDRRKQDAIVPRDDGDCDGFKEGHDEQAGCQLDCDDRDPAIHPGTTEICANGIDENCCADNDGQLDLDGDGFATCGTGLRDCVDGPRGGVGVEDAFGENVPPEEIHPGAIERCDGVDNDCNAQCDEVAEFDGDRDGYLNCSRDDGGSTRTVGVHRLGPDGATCAPSALDCADGDPVGTVDAALIHPGAVDNQCDGVDQDCDGSCDQALVGVDGDGDGFDACATEAEYLAAGVPQCARGTDEDCGGDDSRFERPGGNERCDGVDFDCDQVLFPAVSPCFLIEQDGPTPRCVIGKRGCDDAPGAVNPGFTACTHDALAPMTVLPMSYCQTTCAPGLDPIQCVSEARADCRVHFEPAEAGGPGAAACTAPATELPLPQDPGAGGCVYTLVGGTAQGAWTVTLVDPLGGTGATAIGCGSRLRVVSAQPDADERTVLVVTGAGPHAFRLERVDGCDPVANLACDDP